MKKLFLYFALFSFLLICTACPSPTFDCVIENNSDYSAELFLLHHKKAPNTNNDTVVLKAKEKTTIAFYYEGDNVRIISKNYNVLGKISARKYIITNLQPAEYNIHNFLPIGITLLDNGMNILADKDTKKTTPETQVPVGDSKCYFFRKIKSDDVVLKAIEEIQVGTSKYSIKKIANYYFLQIKKTSTPVEKHKIFIDVSSEDIVISN
jgi:hypothetical protein